MYVTHNGFRNGIMVCGDDCEQLAFDLHAWFKLAPCKQEDFRSLSEDTNINDSAFFLRHVNSRWLMLVPASEKMIARWDDVKTYFLNYLPAQKEYKGFLANNKRYGHIEENLKEENSSLLQIYFPIIVAVIFTKFLT